MSLHRWIWIFGMTWSLVSAYRSIPRCPPAPANCTLGKIEENLHFIYHVHGNRLKVELKENETVKYKCLDRNLGIDDDSLPTFETPESFGTVRLYDCAPPQVPQHTYASALATLNITRLTRLILSFEDCGSKTAFTPQHFTSLEIESLTMHCGIFDRSYLDFDFLEPLKSLQSLSLYNMVILPLPSWNRLKRLKLYSISPADKSQVWGGCAELEKVYIDDWRAVTLPEGWLANCPRLTEFGFKKFTQALNFPRQMITSTSLTKMSIRMELRKLPEHLLAQTKNLRILDLSQNILPRITRNDFSSVRLLEELNLTSNMFTIDALAELEPLTKLQKLDLGNNWKGDSCELKADNNNVTNQWPRLPSLQHLYLSGSRATRLCREWSQSMPSLRSIYLNRNAISVLRYNDVQLIRANGWEVSLEKNNFEAIVYEERDYEAALKENKMDQTNATIRLGSPIDCDCRWYWLSRVLWERPEHLLLPDLRCRQQWGKSEDPVPFHLIPPEEIICKVECEPGCECFRRAQDNTTQVNCTGAGFYKLPRVPRLREIHMANNHIKSLYISDITESLEYMDLRYNQLSAVDAETAAMMFSRPSTQYRLQGNPFSCSCDNRAFVSALQLHRDQVLDYKNVTCSELPVENVNIDFICMKEHIPLIVGAISSTVVLILIALAVYFRFKREIYIILTSWGWCSCCFNEEDFDKDKIFDVFISFAHEDLALVMDELLPRLEKTSQSFRVCVHYRDWMPGEYIPTQIARSVETSRRTIIVLSKNFLASLWAIMEFRAAHLQALKDRRPRLIIVLVEDVLDDEGMDEELRAYLNTNTYIEWGDPWFWRKLRYALPHPSRDDKEVQKMMKPTYPPEDLDDDFAPQTLGNEIACASEV